MACHDIQDDPLKKQRARISPQKRSSEKRTQGMDDGGGAAVRAAFRSSRNTPPFLPPDLRNRLCSVHRAYSCPELVRSHRQAIVCLRCTIDQLGGVSTCAPWFFS